MPPVIVAVTATSGLVKAWLFPGYVIEISAGLRLTLMVALPSPPPPPPHPAKVVSTIDPRIVILFIYSLV